MGKALDIRQVPRRGASYSMAGGSFRRACLRALAVPTVTIALAGQAYAQTQPTAAATAGTPASSTSASPTPADAAATATPPNDAKTALGAYFDALRDKRLASKQPAKVEELRATLTRADALALAGQHEDAALLLFELIEGPRFADYSELPELDAARFTLGSSLHELGAEESARHYLRIVIDKGPESDYFAPAFRKYTDVALTGLDLTTSVNDIDALKLQLPEDAQNELRYLRGRAREAAGDDIEAAAAYGEITQHSRFYASAQYLLGAISARRHQLHDAEAHFCKIATAGDDGRFSFYVDGRYFEIKDLARLGLGRVAHEGRRADDAFYYYFQVPQDSPHVAEAMFEAAYATYEGGDHDEALDLLDQLQARFPRSASADEASLLRGYVALSSCEFDKADKMFAEFITRFTPVLEESDRILQNPARRSALYSELSRSEGQSKQATATHQALISLLFVDPLFRDLHDRVRQLDAEAARSSRVPDTLEAIAARLEGSAGPRPASKPEADARTELADMKTQVRTGREAVRLLAGQLDSMRAAGAAADQLTPIEKQLSALDTKLSRVDGHIDDARFEMSETAENAANVGAVSKLLEADAKHAREFPRRVGELRPKLVAAANERALASLTALRSRLASFLRRARIGRIDAVMGSKRRVELQVESLAAGRFPAELHDPLLVQGFLNDDEEYWPFEGEDWPDEYLEHYDKHADKHEDKNSADNGSAK